MCKTVDPIIEIFFSFLSNLSLDQALIFFLVENLIIFLTTIAVGQFLVTRYGDYAIGEPAPPITRFEIVLALSVVFFNSVITFAGWYLWKIGLIQIVVEAGFLKILLDTIVLFISMDFFMYLFHRVAHHPVVFPIVHVTHHKYENPRPLTLFVLNPIEALGFGTLWLVVISVYSSHWIAIVIYLTFNVVFGLLGHTGVEIMPSGYLEIPVLKYISTSTFHAEHHMELGYNFGFYTLIWDKLFDTLNPDYLPDFSKAKTRTVTPIAT